MMFHPEELDLSKAFAIRFAFYEIAIISTYFQNVVKSEEKICGQVFQIELLGIVPVPFIQKKMFIVRKAEQQFTSHICNINMRITYGKKIRLPPGAIQRTNNGFLKNGPSGRLKTTSGLGQAGF